VVAPWGRQNMRRLLSIALVVTAIVGLEALPAAAADDHADAVEPYERDVYVIVGSTLRNPDSATAWSAPLFNVSGQSLGVSWGKFKNAYATSVMTPIPNATRARLTFKRLRPNGVYSVFYGTISPDSENPQCKGVERTLPVRSINVDQKPDRASFVAKADGTAAFTGRIPGRPLETALQVWVSLVYHHNGKTYGSLPNAGEYATRNTDTCRSSFGDDAMRQLIITQKQ
jgi:hypothetical protein